VEADGDLRRHRDAGGLAAGGVDSRSDVAGDHRCAAGLDRGDRRAGRLTRLAGEAGAEDRIDHGARAGQTGRRLAVELLGAEALEVGDGVAAQLRRRPEQQGLDVEAGLGQVARGDQPVAGVVALAADDPHRALGGQLADRLRHRPPGRLHQLQRGHAGFLDCPGVDRAHPVGVE